jgi:L-ascorbate metabolism protein UlaG (beta-lactamase superfamily)
MRLRKYGHSCLLLEEGGEQMLFDPGLAEFLHTLATPDTFAAVSLIVITPWHPDHADPGLIRAIAQRSGATVLAPSDAQPELRTAGIEATAPKMGRSSFGRFALQAIAAPHAALLGSKGPENIAYLINDCLLNPGDSFDAALDEFREVQVLALPVTAPWMTELDAAAFAGRLKPSRIIPVHDGYLRDFFRVRRYEAYRKHFEKGGIRFEAGSGPAAALDL